MNSQRILKGQRKQMENTETLHEEATVENESADSASAQQKISLKDIQISHDLQVRSRVNKAVVTEYAEFLSEKKNDLPAITLFRIVGGGEEFEGKLMMVDGFHRYYAYEASKRKDIPFKEKTGTIHEAIRYGIEANLQHGQVFGREDKKRALSFLLADPKYSGATVRELGSVLHLSKTTVDELKRELKGGKPVRETVREKNRKGREAVNRLAEQEAATGETEFAHGPTLKGTGENSGRDAATSETEFAAPEPPMHSNGAPAATEADDGVSRLLGTMRGWLRAGLISEEQIISAFDEGSAAYAWMPTAGSGTPIRVEIDGMASLFHVSHIGPLTLSLTAVPIVDRAYQYEEEPVAARE